VKFLNLRDFNLKQARYLDIFGTNQNQKRWDQEYQETRKAHKCVQASDVQTLPPLKWFKVNKSPHHNSASVVVFQRQSSQGFKATKEIPVGT
jgi:hypothetical protein